MAVDEATTERVRRVLAGRSDVVEKRMVGGRSFSIGSRMCCGVSGAALMVRVGADARESMLAQPHVRPMMMGSRMVAGFVLVDPPGVATDDALATWIQHGIDFVEREVPPKP
jgi:TfoX/Sxy family transcriptional regulator of competence genes